MMRLGGRLNVSESESKVVKRAAAASRPEVTWKVDAALQKDVVQEQCHTCTS